VIIISTSGEEEDRVRALQLGAREYHVKPIDIRGLHQLARRVKTYLHLFGARICELIEQDRQDVPSR
jgi:DNA-binding response OmpR family regulator